MLSSRVNVATSYVWWAWRMEKKRVRLNRFKVSGKAASIGDRATYYDSIEAGADDIDLKHALMERQIAAVCLISKLSDLDIVPNDRTTRKTLKDVLVHEDFAEMPPLVDSWFRTVPNLMEGDPAELQVDVLLQKLCYAYVTEFSVEPRLGSKVVFDEAIHARICFSCFSCSDLEPIAMNVNFVRCNMCQMLRCKDCNQDESVHGCVSGKGGGVYGQAWKLWDFRENDVVTFEHTRPFADCFESAALYWSFDSWISKLRYHGEGVSKAICFIWATPQTLDFVKAAFDHYVRIRPAAASVCNEAFIQRFRWDMCTTSAVTHRYSPNLNEWVAERQRKFGENLNLWVREKCGDFDYVDFFRESYHMAVRHFMRFTQGFAGHNQARRLYGPRLTQESYAQAVRNFQEAELKREAAMVSDVLASKDKERVSSEIKGEEPSLAAEEDGTMERYSSVNTYSFPEKFNNHHLAPEEDGMMELNASHWDNIKRGEEITGSKLNRRTAKLMVTKLTAEALKGLYGHDAVREYGGVLPDMPVTRNRTPLTQRDEKKFEDLKIILAEPSVVLSEKVGYQLFERMRHVDMRVHKLWVALRDVPRDWDLQRLAMETGNLRNLIIRVPCEFAPDIVLDIESHRIFWVRWDERLCVEIGRLTDTNLVNVIPLEDLGGPFRKVKKPLRVPQEYNFF